MSEHVYKLQSKYRQDPGLLMDKGFSIYESEEDDEKIYAMGIRIPWGCSITRNMVRMLEKIYSESTEEERKQDFADFGFSEDGKLEITDEIRKDMTECQLCISDSGEGRWTLFVNAPDHFEYYNSITLDECVPDIVGMLSSCKAIYRARHKERGGRKRNTGPTEA